MTRIVSFVIITLLIAIGPALGQKKTGTATQTYKIDAARSDIHLLIYRGGVLSNLGHNHVISPNRP